jgi:hypothetical protein
MLGNKKGFGLGMTDWGSWLVYPFILIIFFVIIKASQADIVFEIKSHSIKTNGINSLISILSTPINFNGENILISDLIVLYELTGSDEYESYLNNELPNLISANFGSDSCSAICINNEIFLKYKCGTRFRTIECLNTKIPNYLNAGAITVGVYNEEFEP